VGLPPRTAARRALRYLAPVVGKVGHGRMAVGEGRMASPAVAGASGQKADTGVHH
jgi:hypothetical protein